MDKKLLSVIWACWFRFKILGSRVRVHGLVNKTGFVLVTRKRCTPWLADL